MESEEETESDQESEEGEQCGNHYNSCVTAVTHQKRAITNNVENSTNNGEGYAICPSASSSNLDPSLGAIAATEIFQHLQATSGSKNEVTTELAKILNVLQTTLKEDSSSSSNSSSSRYYLIELCMNHCKQWAMNYARGRLYLLKLSSLLLWLYY